MSYRFVKVTTFYPEFLRWYYSENIDVGAKSYEEQLRALMRQEFGWSDYFARNFLLLGVEAHELVANALPLQQAWAKQQGVFVASERDILLHQLKALKPDVVLFEDAFQHSGDWIQLVKEQVPSLKQVIGWCCAPCTEDQLRRFSAFDYMLTCNAGFPSLFKRFGIRSYLMHHAFEPTVLSRLSQTATTNGANVADVVFIGSLHEGEGLYSARRELLNAVAELGLNLRVFGAWAKQSARHLWLRRAAFVANRAITIAGLAGPLRKTAIGGKITQVRSPAGATKVSKHLASAIQAPLYGIAMFGAIQQSAIGLNSHIDAAGRAAGNSRLFEVTGVGTCLLTDWKDNLKELFEPDREVVAYRSIPECVEKLRWLIEHPAERQSIARAGQARCMRDHTFQQRIEYLDDLIRNEFTRTARRGQSSLSR